MPMGFPRYSQRKLPGVTSAGQVETAHADDVIINTDKDKIPAVDRVDFVFMFLVLLTESGSCPSASHSLLLARGQPSSYPVRLTGPQWMNIPNRSDCQWATAAGSAFSQSSPAGGVAALAGNRPAIKSSSRWIPDRLTMTGLRAIVRFEVCVVVMV
jgi:hypothetical protein